MEETLQLNMSPLNITSGNLHSCGPEKAVSPDIFCPTGWCVDPTDSDPWWQFGSDYVYNIFQVQMHVSRILQPGEKVISMKSLDGTEWTIPWPQVNFQFLLQGQTHCQIIEAARNLEGYMLPD